MRSIKFFPAPEMKIFSPCSGIIRNEANFVFFVFDAGRTLIKDFYKCQVPYAHFAPRGRDFLMSKLKQRFLNII